MLTGAEDAGTVDPRSVTGPAKIRVDGLGLIRDRTQRRALEVLLRPELAGTLDASSVEDGAMILFSTVNAEGYLEAEIEVNLKLAEGGELRHKVNPALDRPLPRPLSATEADFLVKEGRRFTIDEVRFEGLTAIPEDDARGLFRSESALFSLGAGRAYSPARLQRSVDNLAEELRRLGYAQAEVAVADLQIDRATGKVRVAVEVEQGRAWRVSTIKYELPDGSTPPEVPALALGQPWSAIWRQDAVTAIRRWYHQRGHPDAAVSFLTDVTEAGPDGATVDVTAVVEPGPAVTVGEIRFVGNERTRDRVLRNQVRNIRSGEPLNPSILEEGQFNLSRLGVFSSVELEFEPTDGTRRDPVFRVTEGVRSEASVLFGYGSYEQFRGGVELRHYNLWGRAHQDRFEAIQSMKSARGQYVYTVPAFFGTSVDATAKVFGLRRHETSFLRKEYGVTLTAAWPLRDLGLDLTAGYTFRRLFNSRSSLATAPLDDKATNSASIDFGLSRDRRDNPITPRRGYRLYVQSEGASRMLGGQVDYQKLLAGVSYHTRWGRARWFHAGFTHGLITTFGSEDDRELPVNVRFYPGGENSIRGYREGQAAPRAPDGRFLGAKTTMLLNLEVEQAVLPKLSLVGFVDAAGAAARMAHYPFDNVLTSAGLGVRYNTLIGPLRLEYGRNLNPREGDPSGTLLFALGFPF